MDHIFLRFYGHASKGKRYFDYFSQILKMMIFITIKCLVDDIDCQLCTVKWTCHAKFHKLTRYSHMLILYLTF